MNVLAICSRLFPKATINIAKNQYFVREYAVLADYNIKWVRPPKLSFTDPKRSGDLGLTINLKSTDLVNKYEDCEELKDANDIVKKLLTFEYHPHKQFANVRKEKTVQLVKRHTLDYGSAEVTIAIMTHKIQHLQECFSKNPTSKPLKVYLKELIDKRKKLLKRLRVWDYKRYEWVLGRLNLIFKAGVTVPGKACRKDALRKLTQKHCDKIVEEKLNAYKEELKKQQKGFYEEKLEKLIFIRNEELGLGLEPTVTEEEIEATRKKMESYH